MVPLIARLVGPAEGWWRGLVRTGTVRRRASTSRESPKVAAINKLLDRQEALFHSSLDDRSLKNLLGAAGNPAWMWGKAMTDANDSPALRHPHES